MKLLLAALLGALNGLHGVSNGVPAIVEIAVSRGRVG